MKAGHSVQDYERRLQQIPKHNKQLEEEIRNMQDLVDDQCTYLFNTENDINTQNAKIKLLEE